MTERHRHEGAGPGNPGTAPFAFQDVPRSASEDLAFRVGCPCGSRHWREITATDGLAATERHCPRCRKRYLVVFREGEVIGTPRLFGRNERALRRALRETGGLTTSEADELPDQVLRSPARRHTGIDGRWSYLA